MSFLGANIDDLDLMFDRPDIESQADNDDEIELLAVDDDEDDELLEF
jgi:hypothetical protein